jgi:hypothetical protein
VSTPSVFCLSGMSPSPSAVAAPPESNRPYSARAAGAAPSARAGDRPPKWARVFELYAPLWRRLAQLAALRAPAGDVLVARERAHLEPVVAELEQANWRVRDAVGLVLMGVRDLRTAAEGCDDNSREKVRRAGSGRAGSVRWESIVGPV